MQLKSSAKRLELYNQIVKNRYNLYNSLFLNLPYGKISSTGEMIPLFAQVCKRELANNKKPNDILKDFCEQTLKIHNEEDQISFMFEVIQFVERQIVLFDSVEDAAFLELNKLGDYFSIKDLLKTSNRNEDELNKAIEKLNNFSVRIVFTAHPTQFYASSVLGIIKELQSAVSQNNIENVDLLLRQLGMTSLLNSKQPTPIDEAKNIIYYLRTIYYDALPQLYQKLEHFSNGAFNNLNIVRLGFWPGGDRDGNPYVTAAVTKLVADELRMTLAKCYYNEIKKLQQKITFKGVADELAKIRELLYKPMFDNKTLIPLEEILTRAEKIKENVSKNHHNLFLAEIENFITKLKIFQSHFATIDIRQDHSKHYLLVQEILKQKGFIAESLDELDTAKLKSILLNEQIDANALQLSNELSADTIENITQLKSIQEKNGELGCNRYIISNSEDIFSVLFVFALFRWCGYSSEDFKFDIVPLFETMDGMENSTKVMTELFEIEAYSNHIKKRNGKHTIMLGFSDGTKDGGYLKANWSIFQTKERLTKVCRDYGFEAIFFDGRGGPPARGGGKTHRFYASQGKNISSEEIQLTIQGQTITSTYGSEEQFVHNCEQLITSSTSINKVEITNEQRDLISKLADLSYKKYVSLKQHEKFIDYLEEKSTLRYYKKARIGSRPGKRGNKAKLELTDLRAISFVGSWSQLKQNVPGYFGIGTALQEIKNAGEMDKVKSLFKDVSFFKALLANSMMALTKCYFELTAYMEEDPKFSDFWKILYEEYTLTKNLILEVSGFDILMEEEPISRASISMRESIVLPLLVIQQNGLQKIAEDSSFKEIYEKIVVRSLYGNINASRNSA